MKPGDYKYDITKYVIIKSGVRRDRKTGRLTARLTGAAISHVRVEAVVVRLLEEI